MLNDEWSSQRRKVAVLMPTLRCPISCTHCLLSCTPGRGDTMSPELARTWTAEFIELGFSPICLTGGEPFLRPKVLEAVSRVCGERSTPLVLQTNGFWAKSIAGGRSLLARIPFVTQIGFSVDYAHLRFIPRETIENALSLSYERGIENLSLSISYQTIGEQEEIESYFRRRFPKLTVDSWPITPIGRALHNPELCYEYQEYSWDFLSRTCEAQQCFTPLVYPNGDVHLCYHLLMCLGRDDPFLLGNLNDTRFSRMMADLADPLYFFMVSFGGGSLGYLLEAVAPEFLEKRYQRVCQLCYAVLSRPDLVARLREILALPPFLERMREMLRSRENASHPAADGHRTKLYVCRGRNCLGNKRHEYLKSFLMNRLLDSGKLRCMSIEGVDCMGLCKQGPNMALEGGGHVMSHVDAARINALVEAI